MAKRIVTDGKADRTPDWDKWLPISELTLWECLALSLNIDPDKVWPHVWMGKWVGLNGLNLDEAHEFDKRAKAALGHFAPAGEVIPLGTYVDRRQFAAWVLRARWDVPPEFLDAEAKKPMRDKRATEARHREWQDAIGRLAKDSPGRSHEHYCDVLGKQRGIPFTTIRRYTRAPRRYPHLDGKMRAN